MIHYNQIIYPIDVLKDNPSLKPDWAEAMERAYQSGCDLVVRETPLNYSDLPEMCPYQHDQVLDSAFFPGQPMESDE